MSQKLCTDAVVGNFLLEGGEGKTIRRQRVDLGMEGIKEERRVVSCSKREGGSVYAGGMGRLTAAGPRRPSHFRPQNYAVNATGYYCVGASEMRGVNGSTDEIEGY